MSTSDRKSARGNSIARFQRAFVATDSLIRSLYPAAVYTTPVSTDAGWNPGAVSDAAFPLIRSVVPMHRYFADRFDDIRNRVTTDRITVRGFERPVSAPA